MRLEDQQATADFRRRLAEAMQRIRDGNPILKRDAKGNIIPSPSNLKPNVFSLLPQSQTIGEGDA